MTPEKQRIEIAIVVGWKRGQVDEGSFIDPSRTIPSERWVSPNGHPERKVPDFLSDLNAMHEAVLHQKAQDGAFMVGYLLHLQKSSGDESFPGINVGTLVEATVQQRAEAFLRTLGKWENDV